MGLLSKLFNRGAPKEKVEPFDSVIGYSDIKEVLSLALRSRDPVSICFVGPPASAKTLFLLDIYEKHKDQAHFIDAVRASKAGISDYLFAHRPKYLCIDEIDKLPRKDQAVLLNLMETGILSVTLAKKTQTTQLRCWVFATMNEHARMLGPLKSRFQMFHLPEYTREEFIKIGTELLSRKGIDRDMARTVTTIVIDDLQTRDIRPVLRLGKLLTAVDNEKIDITQLTRIVKTMIKYGGPNE